MTNRLAYIDRLRGFAAGWVVLYHLWLTEGLPYTTQHHPATLPYAPSVGFLLGFATAQYGYVGVPLFFVLSGFCIHLPQARDVNRTVNIRQFLWRRFLRLYPAYLASIVFCSLLVGGPGALSELLGQSKSSDWVVGFRLREAVVNALFLQQFWPKALELNAVYWTLVYEVQFYLLYPFLLWAIRRVGYMPLLVLLLASEVTLAYRPLPLPSFFLNHYYEWFLGVYAAQWISGRDWRPTSGWFWLGAVAVASAFVGSTFSPIFWPIRDAIAATSAFFVVLALGTSSGGSNDGVSGRLASWFGLISYSLYLTHLRLIVFIETSLKTLSRRGLIDSGTIRLLPYIAIPLAVLVAYLFFQIFERPFLGKSSSARPRESSDSSPR